MSIFFDSVFAPRVSPWQMTRGNEGSPFGPAPVQNVLGVAPVDTFTNSDVLGLGVPAGGLNTGGIIARPESVPAERSMVGRVADFVGGGIRDIGSRVSNSFVGDAVRGAGRALGIGTAPDLNPVGYDRDWGARLNATGHIPAADRQAFMDKTAAVAGRLGMDPDHLMGVMDFESIGINPAAKNPNSTASGLIQFMGATAVNLGTTTKALRDMPAVKQLDYVESYLSPYAGRMTTPATAYAAVFGPAHIGKPMDGTVYSKGTREYSQNRVNDLNKDGRITMGELGRQIDNRISAVPALDAVEKAMAGVRASVPDITGVVAASLEQAATEEKAKAVETAALSNAVEAAADVAATGGTPEQQQAAATQAAAETIGEASVSDAEKSAAASDAGAALSGENATGATGATGNAGNATGAETAAEGASAAGENASDQADGGGTGADTQGGDATGGATDGGATGAGNADNGGGGNQSDAGNAGSGEAGGNGAGEGSSGGDAAGGGDSSGGGDSGGGDGGAKN